MSTRLKEISVGSTAYGTWYLRIYEDSVSQSVANNQSKVTLRLTLRCSNTNSSISFDTRDAWIGSKHFTLSATQSGGEHNLGSTTITVNHASDGTGSYSYSFGIKTSYVLNGSGSGTRTLATIPRASSISSISGSSLGSEVTVNIDRKSSSFTHTVTYKFGSISRSYTGQSTSCKFTPPLSDGSAIPNSSSGTATVTVQTYSGSTAIGSAVSKSFTLNLPSSAVPSISGPSISRVDNGVPSGWGIYVKGFSKADVSISGSGVYGSSISTYSLSGGGYSSSSSTLNTGVLNTSGTVTFTGTVKDSRGRTKSATASITVYDYAVPSVSITAERCNSDGSANPDGVYVKATATYGIASVNSKNSVSSRKIEVVGTSYSNTSFTSGTAVILGGAISVDKSYVVKVTVTDALGRTSTAQMSIPTGEVIMDIKANGKGVAFGKVAESDNMLESKWPIKTDNDVICNNVAPQYIQCMAGNELAFNSSNAAVWFGYRAGSNGVKPSQWYFGNGSGGRGAVYCSTVYANYGIQTDNACLTTTWLGFYHSDHRVAWIGDNNTDDLWINKENGGVIYMNGSAVYVNNGIKLNNSNSTAIYATWIDGKNHDLLSRDSDQRSCYYGCASISYDQWTYVRGKYVKLYNHSGGYCQVNGAAITSDRNLKYDFRTFDERYNDFFMNLKPTIYKYQTGTAKRDHFGYVAQEVEEALYKSGLSTNDFAGVIIDKNITRTEDDTDSNLLLDKGINEMHLLRYDEFIALNTHMIQKTIKTADNHEQRIAELEESNRKKDNIIDELKDQLQKLEELVSTLMK